MRRIKNYAVPTALLAVIPIAFAARRAAATLIVFDDGVNGQAIGSYYSPEDVIFSNAAWRSEVLAGSSPPMVLASIDNQGAFVPPSDPIVATFPMPVTSVSIIALDVGDAGCEMDAYDALTGGDLVATDQQFGSGLGVGTYFNITDSAFDIQRIQLFQPNFDGNDGILWDNLSFTPVPEPASTSLLTAATIALLARRRRMPAAAR